METFQKQKKRVDNWVKFPSKSRPGLFYLFNTSTGEKKWITPENSKTEAKELPQLSQKDLKSRTPAQDRLKRLQNFLGNQPIEKRNGNTKNIDTNERSHNKSANNKALVNKAVNKATSKKTVEVAKRSSEDSMSGAALKLKRLTRSAVAGAVAKIAAQSSSSTVAVLKPYIEKKSPKKDDVETPSNFTSASPKTPSKCNLQKKKCSNDKKSIEYARTNTSLHVTQKNKKMKTKEEKLVVSAMVKEELIKDINSKNKPTSSTILNVSTPKHCKIPGYERGSAGKRLQNLRQSLMQMQDSKKTKSDDTFKNQFGTTSDETVNDDFEPMDWQPIDDVQMDKMDDEVFTSAEISSVKYDEVMKIGEKITTSDVGNGNGTLSEYYNAVNDNLLRINAEKQKTKTNMQKWMKDHYYFIIDTNVMLDNLAFVEELSTMQLCDTEGTIVYLPYQVLQELDKLKISGKSDGLKLRVGRAIKFLNRNFKANNPKICGQSAIDEKTHHIRIKSPDDSILNCCLQVMEHVEHVVLLSEDVNLRNKAVLCNILASTKSDLVSRHPDSSSPQ